jgi:hypothetical protein
MGGGYNPDGASLEINLTTLDLREKLTHIRIAFRMALCIIWTEFHYQFLLLQYTLITPPFLLRHTEFLPVLPFRVLLLVCENPIFELAPFVIVCFVTFQGAFFDF